MYYKTNAKIAKLLFKLAFLNVSILFEQNAHLEI